MTMNISVSYKEVSYDFSLPSKESTVLDLKKMIKGQVRIPVIQQQLSMTANGSKTVISDDLMPIRLLNIKSTDNLNVKNLGPQVKWSQVFYIEYLGPILIMPLFYYFGERQNYTEVQHLALLMGILHFVKRELETSFVHVFSRPSMPTYRFLINCLHYWIFFGLLNSIELYLLPKRHTFSNEVLISIFFLWFICELLNFKCHLILSNLRSQKQKGPQEYQNVTKKRGIPHGWGFGLVSCANYFWEVLGWVMFSVLTRNWTAYLFTGFSAYQMLDWAIKKHKNYLKQFGDKYPKGRKSMVPFLI